jgi:hypothetical protein
MAVASLVLGIISCVFAFVPYGSIVAIVCGIIAIVFASRVGKELKEQDLKDGKVTAGFVTGIVGLSLSTLWTILWFTVIGVVGCMACSFIR